MERYARIRSAMLREGFDALLLTEEYNRFYATGFPSPGTDGLCLIKKDKAYYFTDERYTVAAKRAVKEAEIGIISRDKGYIALTNEVIRRENIQVLGFDEQNMTVAAYERYKKQLDCELLGCSELMNRLRLTKDEEEVRRLKKAQRISEQALAEVLPYIRAGVTEKEIAAKLEYFMLLHGAEKMSFDPIVVSGENGAMPHGVPGDKQIRSGEFVTMDFGCVAEGYCSDMTRTVAVGFVTEEMRQVYDTVLKAQQAGIAATRAGVSAKSVDLAARKVISDAGYGPHFSHSYGHGVGVEIHEKPNVSPANETLLPVGAVTSAEPGIYIPGKFGARIEDVVVVTEDGCIDLAEAPKELLVLPEK